MSNVARLPTADPFGARNLDLIRRTVAADCNESEFNLFIHAARHVRLDPLRRQIYAFVFSKDDPKKRKMTIITGIDGFRTIADRTGNYAPDEDEPTIESDPALKSPSNPAGIIKATVRVKKFSHGDWHKVTASAYWEEYAPLKKGWSETTRQQVGSWPDGNPKFRDAPAPGATEVLTLDTSGNWGKMPRLMLSKVAEALALRKAWPDDLTNVYAQEEVDRAATIDMLPSEAADAGAQEARMEKIGGSGAIMLDMLAGDMTPIERVPVGQFADRVLAFIKEHKDEPSQIVRFQERNRHALREFWGREPGDALELRKKIEGAINAGEQE
jgi:phage recombination protein Bet